MIDKDIRDIFNKEACLSFSIVKLANGSTYRVLRAQDSKGKGPFGRTGKDKKSDFGGS